MIVLASASPRRRDLLDAAGLAFEVAPSGADETPPLDVPPDVVAAVLAERKARQVAAQRSPADLVVGADTIVAVAEEGGAWRLLGKPESPEEARAMLAALSSTRHQVATGVAVVRGGPGALGIPAHARGTRVAATGVDAASRRHTIARLEGPDVVRDAEVTWVTMRTIAPDEIDAYVASCEWEGKAGGYAIQENADAFVTRLEGGGFDNVVGLPVPLTLALLRRLAPEELDAALDARRGEG